jgi:hypothetical protein
MVLLDLLDQVDPVVVEDHLQDKLLVHLELLDKVRLVVMVRMLAQVAVVVLLLVAVVPVVLVAKVFCLMMLATLD